MLFATQLAGGRARDEGAAGTPSLRRKAHQVEQVSRSAAAVQPAHEIRPDGRQAVQRRGTCGVAHFRLWFGYFEGLESERVQSQELARAQRIGGLPGNRVTSIWMRFLCCGGIELARR